MADNGQWPQQVSRLQIAGYAYALGALAVRLGNWAAVRALADRRVRGQEFDYYKNWLRYLIVHANRAGMLNEGTGGVIGLARNIIRDTTALHGSGVDGGPSLVRVMTLPVGCRFVGVHDRGDAEHSDRGTSAAWQLGQGPALAADRRVSTCSSCSASSA